MIKLKQIIVILTLLVFTNSCIPLRVAPKINNYKIKVAKKFKRKLPKKYAFIFKDPKEANEFYKFIDFKYNLDIENVDENISFTINDNQYFMSIYEIEKPTKYINFFPFIFEAVIDSAMNGSNSYSGEAEIIRQGYWYFVLTVNDSNMNDSLSPDYEFRADVLRYLIDLKEEYIKV